MRYFSHRPWSASTVVSEKVGALNERIKNISYTRIPNDLIRSKLIDPIEFRVFCVISSFCPSFPSYEKIAELAGCSRAKVHLSLRKLEAMGLIFRSIKGRTVYYETFWDAERKTPDKAKTTKFMTRQ